jgi:heat shock protein HslJ
VNRYQRRKGSGCNPRPWILKSGVDIVTKGPDDPMCYPTQRVVETGSRTIASSSDSGLEIVGTVWGWTPFLEANDNEILVDDPENYTIEFMPDGAVQIKADCNSVGGSYTVNGSQLTIELGPTTLVACPPGSLENEYLALLSDVNSYIMEGENLVLLIKYDTGSMFFAPAE